MNLTPISFNGITVFCRDGTCDKNVAASIIVADEYHIRDLAKEGEIFLDIGAYCGHASLLAASLGMRCIAVEPMIENVSVMLRNIEANNMTGIVEIVQAAVGTNHIAFGNDDGEFSKEHRFIGNGFGDAYSQEAARDVERITLDQLTKGKQIHLMKVDCEGGEWELFSGASKEALSRIKYISGELHAIDDRRFKDLQILLAGFKESSLTQRDSGSDTLRLFAMERI